MKQYRSSAKVSFVLLVSVFVMHDKTMLFLSMQRGVVYETFFTRKYATEIAKCF